MISLSLFTPSGNDQSIYYLGQIFGMVGTVLPVKNPTLLLGVMYKILNNTALTIGGLIVVYTTVIGLLRTAAEGEFLGKQWSSIWVPLRMVLGIGMLFPTASGYSVIQIIMMWIIVQSIGAADALWSAVLDFTQKVGSPYSSMSMSGLQEKQALEGLFKGLVCQASARSENLPVERNIAQRGTAYIQYYCGDTSTIGMGKPAWGGVLPCESDDDSKTCYCHWGANPKGCIVGPHTQSNKGEAFCTRPMAEILDIRGVQSNKSNMYSLGPKSEGGLSGSCGTIEYCNPSTDPFDPQAQSCNGGANDPDKGPDSIACKACIAQNKVLQNIITTYTAVAANFVNIDYAYVNFYEQGVPQNNEWINNYCSAANVAAANCCVRSSGTGICKPLPGADSGAAPFYSDTNNGLPSNVSDDAIRNIYVPYPIKDLIGSDDIINVAYSDYSGVVGAAASKALQDKLAKSAPLTDWRADAQRIGWILAGAYYFKIAKTNEANLKGGNPKLQWHDPDNDQSFSWGNYAALQTYRNNYSATGTLLEAISNLNGHSDSLNTPPEGAKVGKLVSSANGSLLSSFISGMSGGGDPLVKLASFGYIMMVMAQVLFFVLLGTAMAIAAEAALLSTIALGTGIATSPGSEVVKTALSMLTPFITAMVGGMYGLGAILGIYVPLIPYIVFTVGAIGWFIQTIEAMTAAPFVALGILSPGGQHDILGKAEPTAMLALNLFLRPSLMVLGLIAGMLLTKASLDMVNAGFLSITQTIIQAPGLFENLLFIGAYTSLVVTVVNKCFSLIYHLPEKVLTWIGGPAISFGEAEALGQVKGAVEGAAGGISSAAGKSADAGVQGAGQIGTAKAKQGMNKADPAKNAGVEGGGNKP